MSRRPPASTPTLQLKPRFLLMTATQCGLLLSLKQGCVVTAARHQSVNLLYLKSSFPRRFLATVFEHSNHMGTISCTLRIAYSITEKIVLLIIKVIKDKIYRLELFMMK